MEYSYDLIHMTTTLSSHPSMYSCILVNARALIVEMNDIRCFLDGKYIMCLSEDDRLNFISGTNEAMVLRFLPYFINVNLNHKVIGEPVYASMRAEHHYPDFHLFRSRTNEYMGVIALTEEEYTVAQMYFRRAGEHIDGYRTDGMWSCRTRSDLFSIMHIAESAFLGVQCHEGCEIIRYIKDHVGERLTLKGLCEHFHTNRTSLTRTIKDLTGMSPMAYVLEERLRQVQVDVLFTYVPITELAEKYGFDDVNYFVRAFKKRYGKAPLQYRNEGRAARP